MSTENIDIEMVMRVARSAAIRVTKSLPHMRDDFTQDLILHVLEKATMFSSYTNPDSSLSQRERENKLFASLIRWGNKQLQPVVDEKREFGTSVNVFMDDTLTVSEGIDGSRVLQFKHVHSYREMTSQEIEKCIPYLYVSDLLIPHELLEKVAMVRNAVNGCTAPQKEVIRLMADGKDFKEIGVELGIHWHTAAKRYKRARLDKRSDAPAYVHKRNGSPSD